MAFESYVFINCPFDVEYRPLMRSLVFCLLYLDYTPLFSTTQSSADIRINEIKKLIEKSKFSIHDISRCRPRNRNDIPRFNMPFELGLDLGCKSFGTRKQKTKKLLILETERCFYQRIISDISGQDIANHNDDPEELVGKIRGFISNNVKYHIDSQTSIWNAFNQFTSDLEISLKYMGHSKPEIQEMSISEYVKFCKEWIKEFGG